MNEVSKYEIICSSFDNLYLNLELWILRFGSLKLLFGYFCWAVYIVYRPIPCSCLLLLYSVGFSYRTVLVEFCLIIWIVCTCMCLYNLRAFASIKTKLKQTTNQNKNKKTKKLNKRQKWTQSQYVRPTFVMLN